MGIDVPAFGCEEPGQQEEPIEEGVRSIVLSVQEELLNLNDGQFEVDHAGSEEPSSRCEVVDEDEEGAFPEVVADDGPRVVLVAEVEQDEVAGVPVGQDCEEDDNNQGQPPYLQCEQGQDHNGPSELGV